MFFLPEAVQVFKGTENKFFAGSIRKEHKFDCKENKQYV